MKSSRWVDVPSIFQNSQTPKIRKVTASWSRWCFGKIKHFQRFFMIFMIFHDFKLPKLKFPFLRVTFGRVWRVQSGGIKKLIPEMDSSRWVDVPNIFWNSQTPKIRKVTASWSQRRFGKIKSKSHFFFIKMTICASRSQNPTHESSFEVGTPQKKC